MIEYESGLENSFFAFAADFGTARRADSVVRPHPCLDYSAQ